MADWPTVVIALVSAGAGIGGGVLQQIFVKRARALADVRDDANLLRGKLEELFLELDRLENDSNRTTVSAIMTLNSGVAGEIKDTIGVGRVRAHANLYFPECMGRIAEYEDRRTAAMKELADEAKAGNIRTGTVKSLIQESENLGQLIRELRDELAIVARRIGKPTRGNAR